MYSENDYTAALQAEKRARLLMLLPAGLLLIGVVWSFIVRIKWLTILLSALAGCWMIFTYQILLVPRKAYRLHVRSALRIPGRNTDGYYLRMEETPVERDNVLYYAFYVNVGEKNDPEDDRLFYFDAMKPLPSWQSGERLRVVSYDKFVSSYQTLSGADAPAAAG